MVYSNLKLMGYKIQIWTYRALILNVAPLISVGNGLSYTMSNCMRTRASLRSLVAHAVRHGVAEAIPNTYKWGNI